jgi:KaiC/GvpD/RAD55 family RecA-like ATPase
MMKNELIKRNPLHHLGLDMEQWLEQGGFGAVIAPAGVGKTALLVQIALQAMMQKHSVLHVSLNDPVHKVTLWYDEILQDLTRAYPSERIADLREDILLHRFIMTFRVDDFTVPKLKERINDLVVQNIFRPDILIIDGLHFHPTAESFLTELKNLAARHHCFVWFSLHIHREEKKDSSGIPINIGWIRQYFNVLLKINEWEDHLTLNLINPDEQPTMSAGEVRLDPTTMLIVD